MALDKDYINKPGFGNKAAHEFGHNLGLRHANLSDVNNTKRDKKTLFGIDPQNRNPINSLESSNVMRYSGGQSTVNSAQIDSIDEGDVNSRQNDKPLGTYNN